MNTPTKPILQFALELATEAHKGQKRKDGKDYITHPIEVGNIIKRSVTNSPDIYDIDAIYTIEDHGALRIILAYLHDGAEDNKAFTEEYIVDKFIQAGYIKKYSELANEFYTNLFALNKDNFGSYKDYICNLRSETLWQAKSVKLADIEHNLSDLKPGSLRDKYELAQFILLNA